MSLLISKELTFQASKSSGTVSAILTRPKNADYMLVLAHGAGAGMRHKFMEDLAHGLAEVQIATFRYQFPYVEQQKKAPNPPNILKATVRSAIDCAKGFSKGLTIIAGGKSLGGRMTSSAAADSPLENVRGIAFFGFPLHRPGEPSADRAAHLYATDTALLFIQGTRDKLADLEYLKPVCRKIGKRATLKIIDDADHSFKVPKRAGKSQDEIMRDLCEVVRKWTDQL